MRIAIMSDIHGNMEAFEKVLFDINHSNVDVIYSLGDNIGYGPEPDLVLHKIQELNITSILGNHEFAIIQPNMLNWFNPIAQQSLIKTMECLSEDDLKFIKKQLPAMIKHGCRLVHGFPPHSVHQYMFEISKEEMRTTFKRLEEKICFIGHTHILDIVAYDGQDVQRDDLLKGIRPILPEKQYIVNVGSVGQPRDGDKSAKYVIYDIEGGSLEVKFIPYDVKTVVDKIIKNGFPEANAVRLM